MLQQTSSTFDLVYAPRAFEILLEQDFVHSPDIGIVYYHCGGTAGNDTQIKRYERQEWHSR